MNVSAPTGPTCRTLTRRRPGGEAGDLGREHEVAAGVPAGQVATQPPAEGGIGRSVGAGTRLVGAAPSGGLGPLLAANVCPLPFRPHYIARTRHVIEHGAGAGGDQDPGRDGHGGQGPPADHDATEGLEDGRPGQGGGQDTREHGNGAQNAAQGPGLSRWRGRPGPR